MNTNIVAKTTAKRKPARAGVVYLLHFERPLGNLNNPRAQAQHYIGWALDVRQRLTEHRNGWGSSLTMACVDRGIPFYLVRFWPGTAELERKLKRQKNARKLCPICRANRKAATAHATQLLLPLDFNDLETNILSIAPRYTQRPDYTEIAYWRGDHRPFDPPPDRLNEPPEPPELKPWEIPF
jgi:predicted GIY-YIG superfamily endonuclease